MKLRELKNETDLENYRHAIATHIDVLLPLDYLKQGKVFGLFNKKGDICGGFAVILEGPFRVLESIPNFKGLKIDPTLNHTAEITGVWLSDQHRKKFSSVKFWSHLLIKVIGSRKKYFVYAYSSHKTGLGKIYATTNPEVLFRGETNVLPGMSAPDHESVEVIFRSRVIIQALKNPDFFIKRIIKSKKKKNKITPKEHYEKFENSILPITSSLVEFWPRESQVNH